MKMPKNRPEFMEDLHEINCVDRFIYEREPGWKVAYLHYSDGVIIYEQSPNHRKGWRLMHKHSGKREFLLQE